MHLKRVKEGGRNRVCRTLCSAVSKEKEKAACYKSAKPIKSCLQDI